jgi:subtilase family serine protease
MFVSILSLAFKRSTLLKKYIKTTACSLMMLFALTFVTSGAVGAATITTATPASSSLTWTRACAAATAARHAACLALIAEVGNLSKVPAHFNPLAVAPGGSAPYDPAELHTAYKLKNDASGTPTVAIVDAYSNPDLASNLATYRSQWGLPACTTSSGCLKIVNETGGTSLPAGDSGWGLEESLDVDMVSAICENCHILVVEASSASDADLGTAVNEAVKLGAIAVSNSYGESEFSSESSECSSYFQHTHVAITASTGDGGLGVSFPATCPYVTGVGGTTLNSNGTETDWNTSSTEGAGGGCSAYIGIRSWESSSVTGCSKHATGVVSADADPNTGVYVYDTYVYSGWYEVGGTSESSPIIAAVYALAGNVSSHNYPASLPWAHYSSGLFEVSGVRYSYQGGLGSPDSTTAF